MKRFYFSLELRNRFDPPDWAWLFLALRQDPLVWSTLSSSSFASLAMEKMPDDPVKWSIAALSLLRKLDPTRVSRLGQTSSLSGVDELLPHAQQVRQAWLEDPKSLQTLEQAGEVALSMKEDFLKQGEWSGFGEELGRNPALGKTILACLLGMVQQPFEPLLGLLRASSGKDLIDLVVHALLCQPSSLKDQKANLVAFLDQLPVGIGVNVLENLERQRPWLVGDLAAHLLTRQPGKNDGLFDDHLETQFADLARLVESAKLNQNASQSGKSIGLLIDALKDARSVQAYLSALLAEAVSNSKKEGNTEKKETDIEAWKQAVRLAPNDPSYASGLAGALLKEGRLADAKLHLEAWQAKDRFPDHAGLLLTSSQVAYALGEKDNAVKLSKRAQELVENGALLDDQAILALSEILNQSGEKELAIRSLICGLREYPTQQQMLTKSAEWLLAENNPVKAIDLLVADVSVSAATIPGYKNEMTPIEIRNKLITALEAAKAWKFAFQERTDLLKLLDQPGRNDWVEFVKCAINADQAEIALEECQRLIEEDPEDMSIMGLYGGALSQKGDYVSAIDVLRKAVRKTPTDASLWLQLAHASKLAGMEAQRLDVLKAASQALPDDVDIQLALGETYLSRNAPTQALGCLRKAANLDDKPVVLLRLGQTLHQLGHQNEASELLEQTYQSVLEKRQLADAHEDPDELELELMHAYARSRLALDKKDEAIPLLKQVVELDSEQVAPYIDLGRALLKGEVTTQDGRQAVAYLQKALSLISQGDLDRGMRIGLGDVINMEAEAMSLLAEAYAASGELQQSQAIYRQVMEDQVVQKTGWRARLAMGFSKVAIKLDQPETALTVLKEALHKEPQNQSLMQALADAYLANGLAQDAYDTASKVMEQQPVEVDTVSWFINLGNQLRKYPGMIQTMVIADMIRVLQKVVQQAPSRVDLLFQLGKLLLEKGERQLALDAFRRLSDLNVKDWKIDTSDLYQAGKTIREWGDAPLSVFLLEKAVDKTSFDQDQIEAQSGVSLADILGELSISYQKTGSLDQGLEVIERAIKLDPKKTALHLQKADIYADLRKPLEMFESLKPALQLAPEHPAVNRRMSQALFINGDLSGALKHAEKALSNKDSNLDENTENSTRYLAAEISLAMLRPRQALAYLPERLGLTGDNAQKMEQASLQAELAFAVGDRNLAETALEVMRNLDSDDARTLAVQARLANQKGDKEAALRFLQSANQSLEKQISQITAKNPRIEIRRKPDRERAVCCAAACTRNWDLAYTWACNGIDCAPVEPFSHLLKARIIVERAEEQALCQDLHVTVHAPGEDALSQQVKQDFESSVSETERLTKQYAAYPGDETSQALNLWRARGYSVFQPEPQSALNLEEAVLSFPPTADEVGAMLMAYRRIDQPAKGIKASQSEFIKNYSGKDVSEHPLVLAQLSLAYSSSDHQKALDYSALAAERAERLVGEQVNKIWPEIPMMYFLQAYLAYQGKLYATALQSIQKALSDWPEEPGWHAFAADVYRGSDVQRGLPNLAKAKTHLELASRLEPANGSHFMKLGTLYLDLGEFPVAVELLEQASRLSPDNPEIWYVLAEAYQLTGDLEKAASSAEQALNKTKDKSSALVLSGEIALRANNPRVALNRAQVVLRGKPDHPKALHLMARSLEALQRPEEALSVLEKNLPKVKDPIPTQMERLKLLYRTQGLEAGLEALHALVEQNIHSPELLSLLAQWLAEAKQDEAAVQTARAALQANQGRLSTVQQADLNRLIGLKMKEVGQLDQAIHALSQAIQLQPEHVENYLDLAAAYQDRREHLQAQKTLEQAMDRFPDDFRPYYQAGMVYKDNKDYLEAEKILRQAVKIAPNEISIHRLLGAVVALNLVHNR